MKKELLVTGCGRSGTTYLSHVLKKVGMDCPHEYMGEDGTVSWYFCVDSKHYPDHHWVNQPKCHRTGERLKNFEFNQIVHLVRNPWKVITSSLSIIHSMDWEWSTQFTNLYYKANRPVLSDKLIFVCHHWMRWNSIVEQLLPTHTFKIEEVDDWFPMWMKKDLPLVSKTMNARTGYRKDMEDVTYNVVHQYDGPLANDIVEQAIQYGYTEEELGI